MARGASSTCRTATTRRCTRSRRCSNTCSMACSTLWAICRPTTARARRAARSREVRSTSNFQFPTSNFQLPIPNAQVPTLSWHPWKLEVGSWELSEVPEPVLELNEATVVKDDRAVLDRLTLTIRAGEHTAILGPNGAGKSVLVSLLTHAERPLARVNGVPPVRVFGQDNWNIFDLRSQLGIVSAALHQHFVSGNSEGRINGQAAVLSTFLNSYGVLRYGEVTDEMRERATQALETVGAAHLT